ncbi:MAG: 50S ribosomal protein L10 [Candidatus Omnitrophica bacterium]|nr:50S ribosomal protein L10 [Candidatus Omnitrophota bacterium]MBU1128866.1 50S ribosomal protein L10 [Candidatus Omnitrophota bacterium]MBU1657142.1 50S ribosomal protein L10 [Candidatus Omnitrophota bacterium]MBU1784417.1 50S ribosomal protein L10 [Candidatus Omnitrophota bacterium]MBU1851112.1 50S ribosomal protein L10 [Candidatus Omnitrophota bacterium]
MAEKYGKKVRELMVKEMESVFGNEKGFMFTSFESIKAPDMDGFRRKVHGLGTKYVIVKKRLGKLALSNRGLSEFEGVFDERKNIGVMVLKNDPVLTAKLLVDFSKKDKNFTVAAGYLEGQVLTQEKIAEIAALPGRKQLLAMVAATMNAPITSFVGVLAATLRSLCYVLNACKDKKEKGN